MPNDSTTVTSAWGVFTRATTTLSSGEVLVHDWYALDVEPELLLRTPDQDEAAALLPRLAAALDDQPGWHRRATDAVVRQLGGEAAAQAELDDAAGDLVLETIEAHPGGDVVLHLDDTCGQHLPHGYWPAVRFDEHGAVTAVTVEA